MIVAFMFLSGMTALARVTVSNTLKVITATVALALPNRRQTKTSPERQPHQRTRFSSPPRRHPHQVMQWEDLEVGREYTSIHVRKCDGRMFEYRRIFAGAFTRTPEEHELPRKSGREHYRNYTFTVHLDGWLSGSYLGSPSYVLWGGDGKPNSYGLIDYLLGVDDMSDQHQLLVPTYHWRVDPHVVVDWTEERPRGEIGEMVWMYDRVGRTQRAAVITGVAIDVSSSDEPMYYVTFLRNNLTDCGLYDLYMRSRLTVRCDSEPVDELYRRLRRKHDSRAIHGLRREKRCQGH